MAAAEVPVCIRAESAIAKYQKGIVRLDVDLIGAHWLNRGGLPVSGKHVHHLWRTILDRHGFVRHRYDHAVVVEVPEGDLQRLREHNQQICDQDPLLPPASATMRYGSLTKTHLIYGLKCFKHGTLRWDDTNEVMVVPKTATAVKEHLQNGIFAMVIDPQAYIDSEDNLISIMLSGNLEQSVAMPEHEIALLQKVMSLARRPLPEGECPWEFMQKALQPLAGARWEDADMMQIFNFAMVVGSEQAAMLTNVHFQCINPAIMVVKPSFFGECAKLPKQFRWCRVAIVVAQYLGSESSYERTGRVLVAATIKEQTVKRLVREGELQVLISNIEGFLAEAVLRYSRGSLRNEVAASSHLAALGGLLARTGRVLTAFLDTTNKWRTKLIDAEFRFRKSLREANGVLPDPILEEVVDLETPKEKQIIDPKVSPGTHTDSAQETVASAEKGSDIDKQKGKSQGLKSHLQIGCAVRLIKRFKGRAVQQSGVVTAIDHEAAMVSVNFDSPPGMLAVPINCCKFSPASALLQDAGPSPQDGVKQSALPAACPESPASPPGQQTPQGSSSMRDACNTEESGEDKGEADKGKQQCVEDVLPISKDAAVPNSFAAASAGPGPSGPSEASVPATEQGVAVPGSSVAASSAPGASEQLAGAEKEFELGSSKRRRLEHALPPEDTAARAGNSVLAGPVKPLHWDVFGDVDNVRALHGRVLSTLHAALIMQAHDSTQLAVERTELGGRVFALQDFGVYELVLVPFSSRVLNRVGPGRQAQVRYVHREEPDIFFMCSESAHEGGHVVPYWYVRDTDDPAAVNLTQSIGSMDFGAWTLRGDCERYNMKVNPGWLEFATYTNCKPVRAGDELRVSNTPDSG